MTEDVTTSTLTDYRNRTVVSVSKLRWRDQEHKALDCEVLFEELTGFGPIPFATNSDADTRHGREIWENALKGEYGKIGEFVPPTPEELRQDMPPLQKWRVDTIIDLEPGLRDKINNAIDKMPEPTRTVSKNKLSSVIEFYRTDPLFELIGSDPSIGKTPDDIDAMWQAALALA